MSRFLESSSIYTKTDLSNVDKTALTTTLSNLGITASSTFDSLTDTDMTGLLNGDAISWNSTTEKWEPASFAVGSFIPTSEKDQPLGVPTLTASGKIQSSQIENLHVANVHTVADIPARDALVVEEGDSAYVQSDGKWYIYDSTTWIELTAPVNVGLSDLNDVLISVPSNEHVLLYNSIGSNWTNTALTSSVVSEGTNLYYTDTRVNANTNVTANTAKVSADGSINTHSDVNTGILVENDSMFYDATGGNWYNKQATTTDLSDVNTSILAENDQLFYDATGSKWYNKQLQESDVNGLSSSLAGLPSSAVSCLSGLVKNASGAASKVISFTTDADGPADSVLSFPFTVEIIGFSIKYLHTDVCNIAVDPGNTLDFQLYNVPNGAVPEEASFISLTETLLQITDSDNGTYPSKFADLTATPITVSIGDSIGARVVRNGLWASFEPMGVDYTVVLYIRIPSLNALLPSTQNIDSLTNVNPSGKVQDSILKWDAVTSKWIITQSISPGSHTHVLADITDLSTTNDLPENTNLYYTEARVDANSSVVANTAKVSADGLLSTHSNVVITSVNDNEILAYDIVTGNWINQTATEAGLTAVGHTHIASDVTDFSTSVDARITLQKATSNGLATLDGGGKIPASQLSLSNVLYVGTWNATTNTPTLVNGTGTQGNYYVVSTDGSINIDGVTDWKVGDWVIFNGVVWEKSDHTDQVSSVAGKTGAVTIQLADITDLSTTNDLPENTNLYYTEARVDANSSVVSNNAKISADGLLSTHSDVVYTGLSPGHILVYNGANWANSAGQLTADAVTVNSVGTPTFGNLQKVIDGTNSPGIINGFAISDVYPNINVASGSLLVRDTDTSTAGLWSVDLTATNGLSPVNNNITYVYARYNGGTPDVLATFTKPSEFNTNVLIGTVYKDTIAGVLNISQASSNILSGTPNEPVHDVFKRNGPPNVSSLATRQFQIATSKYWKAKHLYEPAVFNSNVTTFRYWKRDGSGGHNFTSENTLENTTGFDNNSGTLQSFTAGYYSAHHIYLNPAYGTCFVLYPQSEHISLYSAKTGADLVVPEQELEYIFLGRLIIQQGNSEIVEIVHETDQNVGVVDSFSITYDNTISGLSSTDIKNAIDEVDADLDTHLVASNPHAITKSDVGLTNVLDTKVNHSSSTFPIATDDSGSGYSVGSTWIDIVANIAYVCVDDTVAAAIWDSTNTGGGLGEVNTSSSSGGISLVKAKVGVDLPFKGLTATSTKISLSANTNDIGIDVTEANLEISKIKTTGTAVTISTTVPTSGQIMKASSSSVAGWSDEVSVLTTNGDILTYTGGLNKLAIGAEAEVLTVASGFPVWAAAGGGGGGFDPEVDPLHLGIIPTTVSQAINSIVIGNQTEQDYINVSSGSINIGRNASGNSGANHAANSTAIGQNAGRITLGGNAVCLGAGSGTGVNYTNSGGYAMGNSDIAIGYIACPYGTSNGSNNIALGAWSLYNNLGGAGPISYSVNIGYQTSFSSSYSNTILLNATGGQLNPGQASSFYVKPIRGGTTGPQGTLEYNSSTGEVTYNGKAWSMDHPYKANHYLAHCCVESDESLVLYRGKGEISEHDVGSVKIVLPYYCREWHNFSVHVSPTKSPNPMLYGSDVIIDNKETYFRVHGSIGHFSYIVYANNINFQSEIDKNDVERHAMGPYSYFTKKE